MVFLIRWLVPHVGQATTLKGGMVVMTGMLGGIGYSRMSLVYLKEGDDSRSWIRYGLGSLINPIVLTKGERKGM